MKIHDITLTTSPRTLTWEGTEQGFSVQWAARLGAAGAVCNLSVFTDGTHTGTHLDAPLHFVPGGASVEALDVNVLVGPALVVEVYGRDRITAADLGHAGRSSEKTRPICRQWIRSEEQRMGMPLPVG